MLLVSAGALYHATRAFSRERARARRPLFAAIGLGAFFVCFQGYEWVSLVSHGLTLTSSNYGSFFYLIVGTHGLHALALYDARLSRTTVSNSSPSIARKNTDSRHDRSSDTPAEPSDTGGDKPGPVPRQATQSEGGGANADLNEPKLEGPRLLFP